jgi:hypothetical protein
MTLTRLGLVVVLVWIGSLKMYRYEDVPEAGAAGIRLCKAVTRAGPGNLGSAGADSA